MEPTKEKNTDFYRNIKLDVFRKLTEQSGFHTGIDLDMLMPYLHGAKTIAELGSGYGRCVYLLREKGFKGKILAVERIKTWVDFLQKSKFKDTEIIEQDIRRLSLPQKVDAVLWMWSGILEQNPEEQESSIARIHKLLNHNGYLFIETPDQNIKLIGNKIDKHTIKVETEWGNIDAHLPYKEDISKISEKLKFSEMHTLRYSTEPGLERMLYILKK